MSRVGAPERRAQCRIQSRSAGYFAQERASAGGWYIRLRRGSELPADRVVCAGVPHWSQMKHARKVHLVIGVSKLPLRALTLRSSSLLSSMSRP